MPSNAKLYAQKISEANLAHFQRRFGETSNADVLLTVTNDGFLQFGKYEFAPQIAVELAEWIIANFKD